MWIRMSSWALPRLFVETFEEDAGKWRRKGIVLALNNLGIIAIERI